jgi:hypothetical protein
METKSIFEWLAKESDFLAVLFLLFLLLLHWKSEKEKSVRSRAPISEREYNWDPFGTVRKLTREQIRAEPGYENLSDEEVDNIIETNYQMSLICYNSYKANITSFYIGEY